MVQQSPNASSNRPPARQIALIILFIVTVAAGLSASALFRSDSRSALLICGGALVLCVVVLVIGSLIVAAGKPE
ncbi:MAG: hypothetical protein SF029_12420 [bacterium]|nr:hypothetical protein [bacterium]